MRILHTGVLCTLMVLFAASSAVAQETDGSLAGTVVDADGRGLSDATVVVEGDALLGSRTTASDPRGAFLLRGLPVGRVTLRIERLGHRTVVVPDVEVTLGGTTHLGVVHLPVTAVELEPLVVRVGPSLPDPGTTGIEAVLTREELQRLPLGRDYKTAVKILPHVDESFLGDPVNVAGGTGLENSYFIDGVNVTDVYGGRTGTDLRRRPPASSAGCRCR